MFSPIQQKILDALSKKKLKMNELAELVYEHPETKPMSPGTSIRSAIDYINMKCERNKLNWRIVTEGNMGCKGKFIQRKKI